MAIISGNHQLSTGDIDEHVIPCKTIMEVMSCNHQLFAVGIDEHVIPGKTLCNLRTQRCAEGREIYAHRWAWILLIGVKLCNADDPSPSMLVVVLVGSPGTSSAWDTGPFPTAAMAETLARAYPFLRPQLKTHLSHRYPCDEDNNVNWEKPFIRT